MKLIHQLIIIITTIISVISCRYESIDQDKHPEIPFFPETTNTDIKFTKLDCDITNVNQIDSIFFRIKHFFPINKDTTEYYLFYYDNDLITKKDSIPLYNNNFIDKNGFIYSSQYEKNEMFRLNIRTKEKNFIKHLGYNAQDEYMLLLNKLQKKEAALEFNLSDSLKKVARIDRRKRAKLKILKEFKRKILTGLLMVEHYNEPKTDKYLLKYSDREVTIRGAIGTYGYEEYISTKKVEPELFEFKNILDYDKYDKLKYTYPFKRTKNITVFDKAVKENHFGRNSTFFFSQSGYQYAELIYKGKSAKFKFESHNLNVNNEVNTYSLPYEKTILLFSRKSCYKLD